MTKEQRAERLNKAGFTTIHLIGGFYLARHWSTHSKKKFWFAWIPLYQIVYFKKESIPMPQVSAKVVKPKGKMRIGCIK